MKRFLLFWTILSIILVAPAQERNASNNNTNDHSQTGRETHVTANEARAIGLRFLNANSSQTRGLGELQMATAYRTTQGDTAFYVFNTANGFVMVSADRRATPILGYSDEGAFDVNNVPIQMQSYLQGFVEQIAYGIGHPTAVDATTEQQWDQVRTTGQLTTSSANVARGNNLVNTAMENNRMTKSVMMAKDSAGKMVRKEVSLSDLMNGTAENSHIMMPTLPQNNRGSRSGSNGVAPLITANWDQSCYYNALCPTDADGICGHTPTGCVATAMGMIMRYWGYPAQGTGTHSYTPDGYPEQTVNFGTTTYDWDNMPDQLDENSTQAQVDAVSTLLWHCGVAVDMVYGAYTSSALDGSIPAAFHDYYGYCTPYYQYKEDNASWLELVKSSIDRQRPLLYFATDATGLGGHAFVCDGYNAADQLHFNWGWGGNGNGYFAVDALNVDVFQFNNDVHALFGIIPPSEFQLRYNIIEGGVEVTYEQQVQPELGTPSYNIYPDTIIIPSQVTIDGTIYSVVAIGDKALQCLFGLKKVVIPNTIKHIGEFAFYSSGQLPDIKIMMSDSVIYIGEGAFLGTGIRSIYLPNSLTTIGRQAFDWCWNLTSVTIPRYVTTIGDGTFLIPDTLNWNADSCVLVWPEGYGAVWPLAGGTSVITIGENVRYLPQLIFAGSKITTISFPESLSYIDQMCFDRCDSLTSITIPESIKSIGTWAFENCSNLNTVYFNAKHCQRADRIFRCCPNLHTVNFGDNVTEIPASICCVEPWNNNDNTVFTSFLLPDSVIRIGEMAFSGSQITTIKIPESVVEINNYAFYGCPNLASVDLSSVLTPPLLGYDRVFEGNANKRKFLISCESYDTYFNDESWVLYRHDFQKVPETEIQLTALSNDTTLGFVDIYSKASVCDSTTIFYAHANDSCSFVHWSNGSIANPDTLLLTSDTTIVAFFTRCYDIEPQLTVLSNDTAMGTVKIVRNASSCDSTVVYHANADYGYVFDHWSNGRTSNPDTLLLINDTTIVAYFVKDQFQVDGTSAKLTYYMDFENVSEDTTWYFKNGEYPNRWYINDLDSDNRALFISADNGLTNSSINSTSFVFAYTPIQFNVGNYAYSYKWRCDGHDNYASDELYSGLIPYSLESDFIDLLWWGYEWCRTDYGAHWLSSQHIDHSNWEMQSGNFYIDNDSVYNLVFYWDLARPEEDYSNDFPAAVDNIVIGVLHPECGYFIGVENVDYLDTVSITAVPNPGYRFVCWYDCDTNISKQVVVTGNMECVAYFEAEQYSVIVNSSDTLLGTVSGGGVFEYSEECTITATPAEGYHFFRWNDGNTNNPRTITVTQDTSFTAIFAACANTSTVESVSANESYLWADSLYTASGIYEHTWTTAEGCDSTVSLWLTITKTQYDTTYIEVHDSTYVDVHDTTYLWQYDTTYVDVPYPVHDTTYVDVHDTTYLWQYDTTYVNVPYPVHDTTYVDIHDTTYVDVPYPVHDTTYVNVHDTTYVDVHDTTYVDIHDTTYIDVYVLLHDTTYIDVPYPVHDTTYVTLTDTIVFNLHDTTYVTVHDTITVTEQLTWYSLQVLSADLDKGVAAGSGQFPEGTDVEIAAVPIEGNRFLQWSDGSEANPRTVTVDGDLTLTAFFTTVGVADLVLPTWYVYPEQGAFVVKGAGGHQVSVYDAAGKLLHRYPNAPDILRYSVPASGSYLIQMDNGAAKKVPVVR